MRAGRTGRHDRVVGAHQAVFDADLARDQVDQPPVDEVRADPARSLFGQHQALALDPRQAADARADRAARAQLGRLVHLGQARILQRLAGRVDAVDDEGIDLALDLVIDALVGVEAVSVILGLHLARNGAFLVAGVEPGDRPGAALAGDQVLPACLDIGPQRGDKAQTGDNDTAHVLLHKAKQAQPAWAEPVEAPFLLLRTSKKGGPSTSSGQTVLVFSPCWRRYTRSRP